MKSGSSRCRGNDDEGRDAMQPISGLAESDAQIAKLQPRRSSTPSTVALRSRSHSIANTAGPRKCCRSPFDAEVADPRAPRASRLRSGCRMGTQREPAVARLCQHINLPAQTCAH